MFLIICLLAAAVTAGAVEPSPVQTNFESYVNEKLETGLSQFGYDMFAPAAPSFEPAQEIPVGPEYLLGPGDELRISLWGKVNANLVVTIDRDGMAALPDFGVVSLAGLTFAEAKEYLAKEMSRYYTPGEVNMNVSMGRLRTIRIFVVGKVARPGSYTVSSFSTLINALFVAGGPAKTGSMRKIQVKRAGNTLVHFDLYDFILKGDKTRDIRLMPEDVVFVPPVGSLVAISGEINSPAIYEIKDESTVEDMLALAGGLNDIAFKGRVQVSRVVDNLKEVVFESSLDTVAPEEIPVMPGDIVSFFSVVPDKRVALLSGAVYREGAYGVSETLTVKKLIEMAGGLKPYAYTKSAELTRVNLTQEGPETVKIYIDLEKALAGDTAHNIELEKDDYLLVRTIPEWDLYKIVKVSGEVRFPGSYTITKNERVSDLIERAGGFTDKAYLKGSIFTRESVRILQQKSLDEAIDRFEKKMLSESAAELEATLSPEDIAQQEAVGRYRKALLAKMKGAKAQGRISVRLTELEEFKGSPSDLVLEDGDSLEIPETPSQVQVMGSVYNPTAFVYTPGGTVSNYIGKAGGLTREADDDEIYVLKVDGTALSKRQKGGFSVSWDSENNEWVGGGFMSARLDPGDTVVVPEEIEHVKWLREVKDITQILYQIAVTAGVLIVAF